MLQDNFGRKFYYLRLSITDVCNFRCNYCLPDGYECDHDRDFLKVDEIKRIANAFAQMGTEKIRITGGEPSLRKDLPEIIRTVKQTAGIKTVAMTSNGFKLTEHIDDWIDAGLDSLNLSIDSLDPRQFQAITGKDKLQTILDGIEKAQKRGFNNIKVNTVLMREYNHHEMKQFLDWVKHTPISLRFIELMQTGDNQEFFDKQHVSGANIKAMLLESGWMPVIRKKDAGPAEVFSHPDYQGTIGLIMPYSKDFCATCNRLRVSSLGKLHLCLFTENGLSLREHLQTDDSQGLKDCISHMMTDKKLSHYLQEGITGGTKHLAMLGG